MEQNMASGYLPDWTYGMDAHGAFDGVSTTTNSIAQLTRWSSHAEQVLEQQYAGEPMQWECSSANLSELHEDVAASYRNQHHSGHAFSSGASAFSTTSYSGDSIFSQQEFRNSFASANTVHSQLSEHSRESYIAQAERQLNANSFPQMAMKERKVSRSQAPQTRANSERNPFSTCVSRTPRSRRSSNSCKYWCTSCKIGFGAKFDWKRHEEQFQERSEMYQCDLCDRRYFLDKDYLLHHQQSHRCKTCSKNKHVETAKRIRRARTAWGCGFCNHYDTDWNDRCAHVALHFEQGKTMDNWKHTRVILSLLHQPIVYDEWRQLLYGKEERKLSFGWNQSTTGRAEGYPESGLLPQLQDLLEYFTVEGNVKALVEQAYKQGRRRSRKGSSGSHGSVEAPSQRGANHSKDRLNQPSPASPLDKELPVPPPMPPVPPKDEKLMQTTRKSKDEWASWDVFISTIPEDDVLPDTYNFDLGDPDDAALFMDTDFDPLIVSS